MTWSSPLLTEGGIDGRPISVHEANVTAARWRAEVNAAVHSEISAVPDTRWSATTSPVGSAINNRPPFCTSLTLVPISLVGTEYRAEANRTQESRSTFRVTGGGPISNRSEGNGRNTSRSVTSWLTAPGQASVLDAHYDGPRPAPSRGPRPRTVTEQQFCALGPAAEAFLVGAAAIGNTRLAAELDVLLALGAAHGTQALVDALTRAVAFKRFRAADVRSILAAGTSAPSPVPSGGALVVDLPVAPARPLTAYSLTAITGTTSDSIDQTTDTATGANP